MDNSKNQLSINNYLDISDNEIKSDEEKNKSKKVSKRSQSKKNRKRSKTHRRYKKKHKKKSRSRSPRCSKSRDSSSNSRSYRRSTRSRRSRRSSSSKSSRSSSELYKKKEGKTNSTYSHKNSIIEKQENIKKVKWTSNNEITDEKKIITIGKKNIKDPQINVLNNTQNTSKYLEEKETPNFSATGILASQTNTINGILLKFTEPLDSSNPKDDWKFYTFKDKNETDILPINKKSCYLIGKDEKIVQILVNHPSCSRQHAVIQFRKVPNIDSLGYIVKPYIMDIDSTNGTFLNKIKIDSARYYELKPYDVLNFGFSTRDYVLMKVENDIIQ